MKIMIVGAGEIGRHLALRLSRAAHEIVVIEHNETVAADLSNYLDAKVIAGNGSSANTLIEAGVATCQLFIALTTSNETNLVCCEMAKGLGAQRTICRVHPGLQREEFLFDFKATFNIDYLFSSERLAAIDLFKFIRNPDSLFVEEIARGTIEIQQVRVPEKSGLIGKSLRDMKLPARVRVGAIRRGELVVIPTAFDEFVPGDIVTLIGEPHRLHQAIGMIDRGFNRESLRVVIYGGGEYGFALAQMLESWNCKVRILERDADCCADLTGRLSDTTILNLDATSLSAMREERVGEADFFVATSSQDEDNVMTCLQAHNLGAKRCLTLIHRSDYADAIGSFGEHLGIVAAVSPRESTAQELKRFVSTDRYHVVKEFEGAQVLEATVSEGSRMAGKAIKNIDWPTGSMLVALLRGVQAHVPAAQDVIEPDDNIYAIVARDAIDPFLRLLRAKS